MTMASYSVLSSKASCYVEKQILPLGVVRMAGTLFVTLDPIHSLWTQSDLAVLTVVASLTKAGTAYMVALPSVHTLTCLGTVYSIRSKWAFLLAPVMGMTEKKGCKQTNCKHSKRGQDSCDIPHTSLKKQTNKHLCYRVFSCTFQNPWYVTSVYQTTLLYLLFLNQT